MRRAEPITLSGTIKPGERGSVDTGIGSIDQQTFQGLRFRVDKAQAVEPPPKRSPGKDQMFSRPSRCGCTSTDAAPVRRSSVSDWPTPGC